MRISPGILTIAEAQSLTAALAEVEKLRRQVELLTKQTQWGIPAKITGESGSGSGATSGSGDDVVYLSWVEQDYDNTGGRKDRPNGLFGSGTYMPARHPNRETIPTFPFQGFVRRSVNTAKGPEWEIVAGGGTGASGSAAFAFPYTSTFSGGVTTGTQTLPGESASSWSAGQYYVTVFAEAEGYLGSSVTRLLQGVISVASGTAAIAGGTDVGGANTAGYAFRTIAMAGATNVTYQTLQGNGHFLLTVTTAATLEMDVEIADGPNFVLSGWVIAIKVA